MILTVTPNPAIDVSYRVPTLAPGETHRVASPMRRGGGKGINVARVIRQRGGDAFVLTFASNGRTGRDLRRDLAASAIPHELIAVTAQTRTSIAIVEANGQATVLNEEGAPLAAIALTRILSATERLAARSSCVVGSGSLPPGAPRTFYASLVAIAKGHGIPSIIDASGDALLIAARAGASVVKPNARELAEATGLADPVDAAEHLIDLGAGLVLVSQGERGMLAVGSDGSAHLHARLAEPLVGNPTGAGDAAVAAVASGLTAGVQSVETLLRMATAWSAAAVLSPLAGEIDSSVTQLERQVIVDQFDHTRGAHS